MSLAGNEQTGPGTVASRPVRRGCRSAARRPVFPSSRLIGDIVLGAENAKHGKHDYARPSDIDNCHGSSNQRSGDADTQSQLSAGIASAGSTRHAHATPYVLK